MTMTQAVLQVPTVKWNPALTPPCFVGCKAKVSLTTYLLSFAVMTR